MVLITTLYIMSWTSIHNSSGTLSDLVPWIYLSLPLYNHKGFGLGYTWSSGFPYFLQFKSEFCNKEFIIWATVNSWCCFCWLYRASPCLAENNIINMISLLIIWWCPRVQSSLVLLQEGVYCDHCILLEELCFILYSKATFACFSRYLLTSYFRIPVAYNEEDIIWGVNSRTSYRSSQNRSTSASSVLLCNERWKYLRNTELIN